MFCALAWLLWLSTVQAWSRLYHLTLFFVCAKIFFYSVFFYISPFQQGVSLLMPSLFSLPCSGLKILNALLNPEYSALYCSRILFACMSVCSVCVTFSSSSPVFLRLMTYTEWRLHRMTAGVTALGSEHFSLRMLLFAGLCWRDWDRSEGPLQKTHAATHQQGTALLPTPPHHMELTDASRKKKPWATSCKGTCVFWQNLRSGKNGTFGQQKWHFKKARENEE